MLILLLVMAIAVAVAIGRFLQSVDRELQKDDLRRKR